MKSYTVLIFFVAAAVVTIKAQLLCRQGIAAPNCTGAMDVGTNCTTTLPGLLWYFDQNTRTCRPLNHLGCGGNSNRWCSLLACTLTCILSIG